MQADIAEEIARIFGYDEIPVTLPSQTDFTPKHNHSLSLRQNCKLLLRGFGFDEIATSPFIGKDLMENTNISKFEHLQLTNPQSADQEFMRRHLLPQLLQIVKKNLPYKSAMRLYEVNKVFIPQGDKQPLEPFHLTAVSLGDEYRVVKGFVESLFDYLGIANYSFGVYSEKNSELFHPNKTAQIYTGTKVLGTIGYVHPEVVRNLDISGTVISFDIPFENLINHATTIKTYQPISSYPPILQDVTITLSQNTNIGPVMEKMKKASNLIQHVELTDQFKNNVTFRITFQHPQRNLTDREVGEITKNIKVLA
jgi:phenylalanyl-tRNA synthetase beta chain